MDVVLSHIVKRFGALAANDDVTARFAPGRVHGILGENGAGKSTLMRVVCGVLAPDAGSITVDGTVDTNTPGTYTLVYSVQDTDGMTDAKNRTVTVQAAPEPEPEPEPTQDEGDGPPTGPGNNNGNP